MECSEDVKSQVDVWSGRCGRREQMGSSMDIIMEAGQ